MMSIQLVYVIRDIIFIIGGNYHEQHTTTNGKFFKGSNVHSF